jgi:hypothetical protein
MCWLTRDLIIKPEIGLDISSHSLDQDKKAQEGRKVSVVISFGCLTSALTHIWPAVIQFYIMVTAGLGRCSNDHDMYPVIPSSNSCFVPSVGLVVLEVGVLRQL